MSEQSSGNDQSIEIPDRTEEFIDILIRYDDEVVRQRETLNVIFENLISSEGAYDPFDQLGDELQKVLRAEIDDVDDRADIVNALFSLVLNYGTGTFEYLDENTRNSELKQFITSLRASHGVGFERRANRYFKGGDWWSNLKTDQAVRSGQPVLKNELFVDFRETITFSSDLDGGLLIALHFLKQVNQTPGAIGEDSLEYLNKQILEDIEQELVDLSEKIENYEEKHGIDIDEEHPSQQMDELDE